MATISNNFYNYGSYIQYPPQETKEDKVNKVLRSIDDNDRLKDIIKQVKAGKLTEEEAVDIIQADEQFHRLPPVENNWHQWTDSSTTWIGAAGVTTTYTNSPSGVTVTYPFSHGSTSQ